MYYTYCCVCSKTIYTEHSNYGNLGYYCRSCYNQEYNGHLRTYDYSPKPIFYGTGIYYGIELEVDQGGESLENARKILDVANSFGEHLYIKRDGSLTGGFELVSHPMSLIYHCTLMHWSKTLDKLWNLGYSSHDALTSGYHIHIGRSSLGESSEEQEKGIANILYFIDTNWYRVSKFSRREIQDVERWAAKYPNIDEYEDALKHVKNVNYSKYMCINLQHTYSIEFRIFRGTLKYSTFIACIQFVDELCTKVTKLDVNELRDYTWEKFTLAIDAEEKPELVRYLIQRNLTVI